MTDEKKVSIRSCQATLKSGAQVWLGYAHEEPEDESYWLKFLDQSGSETQLRLSREAFEVVIGLKPRIDLERNTKIEMRWQAVAVVAHNKADE